MEAQGDIALIGLAVAVHPPLVPRFEAVISAWLKPQGIYSRSTLVSVRR
jgi:hypothetical protein